MASFTDAISQFNPYVSQLPIDAMVKVGTYKQQKYEEGIQRIQGQIDRVAGLDVVRGVDKQYLQSKLNELGGKLKTVAGGDFSNFQLVNSVGGMANQIGKDSKVVNAVSSTAWYRKQREKIQKDVDEGKSDPSNIDAFDKRATTWLNNNEAGQQFSASYIPHFDVFKFTKETFDAVQPDGYSFDQIYQLGADGKPLVTKDKNGNESLVYSTTMTRLEREGRFPKKVKETLNQVFSDPRVSRQLSITGEYNYKGYDENALISKLQSQREEVKSSLQEQLLDLSARRKNGEDVQGDIDAIDERLQSLDSNYDNYINLAKKDPDQVRGSLYKEDAYNRYVTMFGKIKTKQEIVDNPAWKAQFEMQKEANAQSRWAQTEGRMRWEFKQEQEYKDKALGQAWDIAVLNATTKGGKGKGKVGGLGVPDDVTMYEQGNQFSDIDVIQLQQRDYRNAADDFSIKSSDFIWDNAGFSEIPANVNRLNKLISSGKSTQEAKYTIFSDLAKRSNMPIEDFMTQYINKSTKAYQQLSPEQRAKNPSAGDSYLSFVQSEKNFKTQKAINENIDREQATRFGGTSKESNSNVQKALNDVKEQKVKIGGSDYLITKDDVYDLGLWLKGNLSVLGTVGGVDPNMRTAANEAEKRIKSRGKEALITAVREDNFLRRAYRGGGLTMISDVIRTGAGIIPMIKDLTVGVNDYYGTLFQDVDKVFKVVDQKDFAESYAGRADVIRRAYGIKPNLKTSVFTGDAETDRQLLYDVKRWAGEYGTKGDGKINASGDFGDFRKALGGAKDASDITLSAQPKVTDGKVAVEIVAFGKDSERVGGMTIQPDEAISIGIDVNTLYESREISGLRNYINYNKGVTSAGNPKLKETYIQGDAYFKENNFEGLAGSGYRASGNIVYTNGKYYPIVYVNDGRGKDEVRELPGSPSLSAATSALLGIKPIFAQAVINKY